MSKDTFAMVAVNAVVVSGKTGPEEIAPGNPFSVDSEAERDRLISLGAATAGPVAVAKAETPKKAAAAAKTAAAAAAPADDEAAKAAAAAAAAAAAGGAGSNGGSSEDLV